ncbi:MAG: hypothetical protein QM662_12915, partial [Gordonia sp. (in: high G+C Gram-positive bacteria)]
LLRTGQSHAVADVRCTVPRAGAVACRTANRGLILTPGWHKFFYPAWDRAHHANPDPRSLPGRLRGSNQLPAW